MPARGDDTGGPVMSSANSSLSENVPPPDSRGESSTDPESVGEEASVNEAVETGGEPETEQSLSVDVIFEILKNERRRRVIHYLRSHEGTAELGAIAEHIAALENDKDVKAISYSERKRVYVGLYQCHLPKMDDMDVVDFNRARGRIELTDHASELLPYLDGPVQPRPWYRYYGAVVVGGLAMYALMLADAVGGVLSAEFALTALLVAVSTCTLAQYVEQTTGS
jgi:hypothetical protein